MIEAVLNGRLGNWLFQYAAARALALKTGSEVQLNAARYVGWRYPLPSRTPAAKALRFFGLEATYSGLSVDTCRTLEHFGLRERRQDFRESAWGYDPRFSELGPATRLSGYFQSPRYWAGYETVLREDLTPRRLPDDPALKRILSAMRESNAVSVHVRRGDYLTTERALHGVCTIEYYARAIDVVRERASGASFFVFSDDIGWCREHFEAPDIMVVDVPASAREPALDLYLMSRCSHHVISNSTYSWWSAWLNSAADKIVCTPERWFNDAEMNARAMRDTVPAGWLRIPCGSQSAPA